MTEDTILQTKSECWRENNTEMVELEPSIAELISEEKRPSLYSLSFTDSVCSNSTIELEALEQSETLFSLNDIHSNSQFESAMENNFANEYIDKSVYENSEADETPITVSATKKSNFPNNEFRKCMSLHDVSNILPLQLTEKTVNTVSCETIHSQSLSSTTKSKDSGFQRSVSCLSLTSGKRNYDHVESKVKLYIRNIKESEALRKKNKLSQKPDIINEPVSVVNEIDTMMNKEDLILKIQELKHELQEKALYIDAQQRNYNNLLLKFAEAKQTIDTLRLQRLSLNYSTINESQNLSSILNSVDFDGFEQEMNKITKPSESSKNFTKEPIVIKVTSPVKEQLSVCVETSNSSLTECFRPRKHSTPDRNKVIKNLSPVSKMFCSSSQLNKNYKPLANLSKQENQKKYTTSQSFESTTYSLCDQCSVRKSKMLCQDRQMSSCKSVLKLNNNATSSNHQKPTHIINLPNDDPFDKVKKWQASLPSIDLLGTHISSDCDVSEPALCTTRPSCQKTNEIFNTSNYKKTPSKRNEKENEINCALSQELVSKCRISEMEVKSDSKAFSLHLNQNFKSSSNSTVNKKRVQMSKLDTNVGLNREAYNNKETKLSSFNNITFHNENSLSHFKINEAEKVIKPLNYPVNVKSNNHNFLVRHHATNRTFFQRYERNFPVSIDLHDSSISENESQTYLPKSSSFTHIENKVMRSDSSYSNDDSLSISSSVLGSNPSSSVVSHGTMSKRRLTFTETSISNKVPKLAMQRKEIRTNFVLREPKLNVTIPVQNISEIKSKKISLNDDANSKNTNLNSTMNVLLKTESSQRKAWNARNNVNFYVCKDFYFEKSTSLQDCISIMEGMVEKGSSIIESALDRISF